MTVSVCFLPLFIFILNPERFSSTGIVVLVYIPGMETIWELEIVLPLGS